MKLLASIIMLLALAIGLLWPFHRPEPPPLPGSPSKADLAKIYLLGREIAVTQKAAPETLDELDDAMIRNMLLWGHDYKGCQKESLEATYRCLETITDEEVALVRRAWKREDDFVVEVREP